MLLLSVALPALCFGETLKVGAVFIASDPVGGYGKHAKQAIEFATEEIHAIPWTFESIQAENICRTDEELTVLCPR